MYKGLKEFDDFTEEENIAFVSREVTKDWLEATLAKALQEARSDPMEFVFGALCSQVGFTRRDTMHMIDLVDKWKEEKGGW
jgi:hypothetical protein